MPAFGDRFTNLAEFAPLDPLRTVDCSGILNQAILALMGDDAQPVPHPGGTVYLPPGRWPIGFLSVDPVVIPAEVTLKVAPGAVIVPQNNYDGLLDEPEVVRRPALEIHGELEVSGGMFISTAALVSPVDDGKMSGATKALSTGWVSFPTRAIDAVHPEWWGAGALLDAPDNPERLAAVDTAAMEAALQSALLRTPWSALVASRGRQLDNAPLAVELRSQVRLSHELRVGGREWELVLGADLRKRVTPSVDGLVLRGHRGATSPHLRGQFFGGERVALLSVHRPEGLRLEDLWLDAGEGFVSDLLVVLYAGKSPARLSVTDCRFGGKAQRLAWVLDALDLDSVFRPVEAGLPSSFTEGVWAGEATAHEVSFEGCVFTTIGGRSDPPTALQVQAAGVTASVSDSAFSGSAAAMVALSAGDLRVHRCVFSNTAVAPSWFATRGPRPPVPESGVDVRVGPMLFAPVSVELVSCRSTSLQFLAMDVQELLDQARGLKLSASFDDTLGNICSARGVDCFHGAEPVLLRGLTSDGRLPAPIYWGSNAATTFALTLIGCRLGESRVTTTTETRSIPPGKVAVREPNDQRIYDAWLLPPGPRYEVWNSSEPCNIVTLAARTVSSP